MDQAVAAAERHISAFNRHDLEAHSANETEDIGWTQPGVSLEGREAVAGLQQALWTALRDAQIEVIARVADAETVMSEEILTGTQTGPFVTTTGTVPAERSRDSDAVCDRAAHPRRQDRVGARLLRPAGLPAAIGDRTG
jgi:hypothetical protein